MKKLFFIFTVFGAIFYFSSLKMFSNKRSVASLEQEVNPVELGHECSKTLKNIPTDELETKEEIREAFRVCLSSYIQIKSIPKGAFETGAVTFFETIFHDLDIANKRVKVKDLSGKVDFRENIVATVPADLSSFYDWSSKSDKRSVILLNHMDVVDVNPKTWDSPELPWSGALKNGYIWGRGALDMKGIAITQLISMHLIKAKGLEIDKDIHFLAVADEEESGSGAIGAIKKIKKDEELYALSNADLLLNEGGGALRRVPDDKSDIVLISSEEKGGAWLEVEHESLSKLLIGLAKLRIINKRKELDKASSKLDCKIVNIETPNSQVNVVASEMFVVFDCLKNYDEKMEMIFIKGFPKSLNHITKQGDSKYKVNIISKSSSHGSLGVNESALDIFSVAIHKMGIIDFKKRYRKPPFFRNKLSQTSKMLIKNLGKSNLILKVVKYLTFIPFIKNLVLSEIESEFGIDGLFRTTCQFSNLNYNSSGAKAMLDCRLVHTAFEFPHSHNHAGDFYLQLIRYLKDKDFKIEILEGWNTSSSPSKSKLFKRLRKAMINHYKKVDPKRKLVVTPYLFPAGSDSAWFSNPWSTGNNELESIPSYGFWPAFLTPELLSTFHGSNERFPIIEAAPTVLMYHSVLSSLVTID